jgi:hypothetical protein
MLLQPRGNTNPGEQFHVPSGVGKALILTGVVEEVLPPAKPLALPTKWSASTIGEGSYAPVIKFSCPNCPKSGFQESEFGTAHKTARFAHCGRTETCPDAVAETYLTLWKAYQSTVRTRRR